MTCPAGHVRPMSSKRYVTFGPVCAGCPLRERCTTAKDGRSLDIHPHEQLLRAARAQARTGAFKQAYRTRAMIERMIAWTTTCDGRRIRLRYLGASENGHRLAAQRVRRHRHADPDQRRADPPARDLGAGLTSPGTFRQAAT